MKQSVHRVVLRYWYFSVFTNDPRRTAAGLLLRDMLIPIDWPEPEKGEVFSAR